MEYFSGLYVYSTNSKGIWLRKYLLLFWYETMFDRLKKLFTFEMRKLMYVIVFYHLLKYWAYFCHFQDYDEKVKGEFVEILENMGSHLGREDIVIHVSILSCLHKTD